MHLCVMHLSGVNCTLFKTIMDGLVFYVKARAFKATSSRSRPRPRPDSPKAKAKAEKFGLKAKAKD